MTLIAVVTTTGQFDVVCHECLPMALQERQKYGQTVNEIIIETADACSWCGRNE